MRQPFIRSLGLVATVLLLAPGMLAASRDGKRTESEPFKRLTVEEVEKRLADPSVQIYDGNSDEEYLHGHLPGAIHLWSKDLREGVLPAEKGTSLIFYCHNER